MRPEPLTPARTEAEFSCEAMAADAASPPLWAIEVPRPLRLWASTGPSPEFTTTRALISVQAMLDDGPGDVLACGPALSAELAPGRYALRGRVRSTRYTESGVPPGIDGFAYRIDELADSSCPKDLATRGIHDWDGQFPFTVDTDLDLNADGTRDLRVEYQMAFMNPGTRLLVHEAYPRCLRIVADVPALLRPLPTRTHGFSDLRFSFWELHPVDGFGGRMVFEYDGKYNTSTSAYSVSRFVRCRDGYPGESPAADRERERLCERWLRASHDSAVPYDLVERWLNVPAYRDRLESPAELAGAQATALLRALDAEGVRWGWQVGAIRACAPRAGQRAWVFGLELHAQRDPPRTWSREAFVVVRQPRGQPARVSAVLDASPCPVADVPSDLEAFVDAWIEKPWSAARSEASGASGLRAQHLRLQRARAAERIELAEVSGCAAPPDAPAWLWTARISSPPALAEHMGSTPTYLVLRRSATGFVVDSGTEVRPPHCSP
ncbi:hypothetical protein BE08_35205 [Sorangium cellulosum]|uniref:Uncharacterized protein n=1 Tax=Sorangium cellulosum TaxID=56 RepID=A0A150PVH6_SORCE|nr:hypothetical protein BE08_35205 [Sorangium cellulosum]